MVLVTPDALALFVWRKFISMGQQKGVNCAVFRNEGEQRSSDLIRAAEVFAWERWPSERLLPTLIRRKSGINATLGGAFYGRDGSTSDGPKRGCGFSKNLRD